MQNYIEFMKWAIVYFIDRATQDDRKSKLQVEALFSSPMQAEDNYVIRNAETKRYIVHINELERFEDFYNHIQDINEIYGDYAIYHLDDNTEWRVDELNRYRQILGIWADTKIA